MTIHVSSDKFRISRWQMEFIQKYTRVGDDSDPEFIDDDDVISEEQVSDREFIDDSTKFYDQQSSNYFFKNVATNLE